MTFQIGQLAKIVSHKVNHRFATGEIVEITYIDGNGDSIGAKSLKSGESWFCGGDLAPLEDVIDNYSLY